MKIQLVHQLIWVLVCPIVYKGQRIINISQADIESDTHSFSRLNQVKTFRFFGAVARLRLNVSCESVESCPPSEVKDKRSYLDGPQFPPESACVCSDLPLPPQFGWRTIYMIELFAAPLDIAWKCGSHMWQLETSGSLRIDSQIFSYTEGRSNSTWVIAVSWELTDYTRKCVKAFNLNLTQYWSNVCPHSRWRKPKSQGCKANVYINRLRIEMSRSETVCCLEIY